MHPRHPALSPYAAAAPQVASPGALARAAAWTAAGLGGAVLALYLARRRGGRALLLAGGCGVLARAWQATERRARAAAATPGTYLPLEVHGSVEVRASVADAYAAWRDPQTLHHFIGHLRRVEPVGERQWRWTLRPTAAAPALEWTMVLQDGAPHGALVWHAQPTATLQARVSLTCEALADTGTTAVRLVLRYVPLSAAADLVVRALGPGLQQAVQDDLGRFRVWIDGRHAAVAAPPSAMSPPSPP